MVLQKPVWTTWLENAEIFRKVRKTTFSRSPPGQSLCQWRQKGVSRPNSGGVAVDFHDAQLENQTSDRLRIGVKLLVANSSIDCESFISGLSSPLTCATSFTPQGLAIDSTQHNVHRMWYCAHCYAALSLFTQIHMFQLIDYRSNLHCSVFTQTSHTQIHYVP